MNHKNCNRFKLIETDEQALFQVILCVNHDIHIDGFGNPLEIQEENFIKE